MSAPNVRIRGDTISIMTHLRISEAAALLGVSDDTVRRWVEDGRLDAADREGRRMVDGVDLARVAVERAAATDLDGLDRATGFRSARNHLTGLVTKVTSDAVMSQVELQCGPFRVVSLISTEAVRELGLAPGSVATAIVKATNVAVDTPRGRS